MADNKNWEFPEDVIVDRAMLEALISLLTKSGAVDSAELRKEFTKRVRDYMQGEPRERERVSA